MLLTGSESGGQLRNREEQPRIVRNAGEHADVRWGAHTFFLFLFPLFFPHRDTIYILYRKERERGLSYIHSFSCVRAPVCVYIGAVQQKQLARPGRKSKQKPLLIFFFFFSTPWWSIRERETIRAQSRLADSFIFLSVPDSRTRGKKGGSMEARPIIEKKKPLIRVGHDNESIVRETTRPRVSVARV